MDNKMKFEIDTSMSKIVKEYSNSSVAMVEMYVASSGNNAHNYPITKEAIYAAKDSLHGKPILANYIPWKEDFGGHEPEEIPVGVFLNDVDGGFRVEENEATGEVWMVAKGYIWKEYYPNVIDVFLKKDDKTDVSMEISILAMGEPKDGHDGEIMLYSYDGVTLLGVEPAIKGAHATIQKYSQKQVFSNIQKIVYNEKKFDIPNEVKSNAKMALELATKLNRKTDSMFLFMANTLIDNDKIEFEHIETINKYLNENIESANARGNSNKYIFFNGYGGNDAIEWTNGIISSFEEQNKISDDANFMINENSKELDNLNENSGQSFENSHRKESVMEDKNKDIKQEDFESDEKMEKDIPKEDEMEKNSKDEDKMEGKTVEDKMEENSKDEDEEDNDDVYMQKEKMSEEIEILRKENDELRIQVEKFEKENEELKKYKSEIEDKKFQEGIDEILSSAKDYFSEEVLNSLKEDSKNFSLETIESFESIVKAKCFDAIVSKEKEKEKALQNFDIESIKKDVEDQSNDTFGWNSIE